MNSLPSDQDSVDTKRISFVNWQPGIATKLSLPVLTKSLALLLKAFPTFTLDPEFAWDMLGDIPDELLTDAILVLIQTKREVYPSTNWIAEIRMTVYERQPDVPPTYNKPDPEWQRRYKEVYG